MNKIIKFFISIIVILSFCFVTYASDYETSVTNNLSIGDINIKLNEYEIKDGKKIEYENNKIVLPGQSVSKIVEITNVANPSWIRMKVEYTSNSGINKMDDSMIHVLDNWMKQGDYFYYKNIVNTNETIQFIDTITIPYEWDSDYKEKNFLIVITAEAVQSKNFTPDFDSEDPWFGTLIETCIHSDYTVSEDLEKDFSIIFKNGAEGFIKENDDFFSNFNTLMPGDIVSDFFIIGNHYNKDVEIFFSTDLLDNYSEIQKDLLNKINLKILKNDKEIYNGPLYGKDLNISLGVYEQNTESIITYELSVPKEFTNKYALSDVNIKWIFEAKLIGDKTYRENPKKGIKDTNTYIENEYNPDITIINEDTESASEEYKSESEIADLTNQNEAHENNPMFPKSGDNIHISIFLLFASIIGIIIIKKKKTA